MSDLYCAIAARSARRSAVRPKGSNAVPRKPFNLARSRKTGIIHAPNRVSSADRPARCRQASAGRDGTTVPDRPRTVRLPGRRSSDASARDLVFVLVGQKLGGTSVRRLPSSGAAPTKAPVAFRIGGILIVRQVAGSEIDFLVQRQWRCHLFLDNCRNRRRIGHGPAAEAKAALLPSTAGAVDLDRASGSPPRDSGTSPACQAAPSMQHVGIDRVAEELLGQSESRRST